MPLIKKLSIAWGVICLIGVIGLGGYIAYQIGPGNKSSAQLASKKDVRYVLNWCNLGDERIEKVVHSYISSRSFTGDHLDAHAIRITGIEISELTTDENGNGWFRGDQLPEVLNKGIEFVGAWLPSNDNTLVFRRKGNSFFRGFYLPMEYLFPWHTPNRC